MHKLFLISGLIFSISFDDGLTILQDLKSESSLYDNEISDAMITIVDDRFITATIRCDILLKKSKEPTILKDSVIAKFYDEGNPISELKSDIATYKENFTLKANKNISIYNLETKDSLFFVNQEDAEIIWDENYNRITSDKEFILLTEDGCASGLSFESDVDLSNIKITSIRGTNQKDPCAN